MQHVSRALRVATAVGLTCALGAASTAAARPRIPSFSFYKVVYEGSGSYSVDQKDGPSFGKINATFQWKITYLFNFIHKAGSQASGVARSHAGSGEWSIVSDNGGSEKCSRHGGLRSTPNGGITGRVQRSGAVIMQVIPGSSEDFSTTDGSSGSQACDTTDFWHDWVTNFSKVGSDTSQSFDPLTAFVHLSAADQRAGKVIVNVSNHTLAAPSLTVNPDCGSGNGASCTQSFDWHGTVTFTKTRSLKF